MTTKDLTAIMDAEFATLKAQMPLCVFGDSDVAIIGAYSAFEKGCEQVIKSNPSVDEAEFKRQAAVFARRCLMAALD